MSACSATFLADRQPRRLLLLVALAATQACELKDTQPAEAVVPVTVPGARPTGAAAPALEGPAAMAGPLLDATPGSGTMTAGSSAAPGQGTGVSIPGVPPAANATPSASAPGGALTATSSELLELRMGIVIPVQGVAASSLRDMYAEARGTRVHEAIDIMAPRGTPVLSATAGRVVQLHESKAGGLMIYAADPSDRFILLYGHLDTYAPGLREGMPLVAGQQIGSVGSTGNAAAAGPHLHFAVLRGRPSQQWWKGEAVNPYPLFRP